MNRKYVLKRRAERQEATRRKIVEATAELHRTVGPAETTFSAIAALAGVQRHTVYSHFPDLDALLKACASHFLLHNPPPSPASWLAIADPHARLRHGLAELFAYYEANQEMIGRVLRDSDRVPVGRGISRLQAAAVEALESGWGPAAADAPRLNPMLRLAISFDTWRTLARDAGLPSHAAAELLAALVSCGV